MIGFVIASLLLAIFSLFIGLLVLMRNHTSPVNRRFFVLSVLAAIWSLVFEWTLFLYISDPSYARINLLDVLNRLSYLFGLLLLVATVSFTFYFPKRKESRLIKYLKPAYIMIAALSVTNLVAGTTTISGDQYVISTGQLVWVYLVGMLLGVGLIVHNLIFDRQKFTPIQEAQNRLLAIGFGASLVVGILLAVVSPLLLPNLIIDLFSPLAQIFFLIFVASAIARHKLFDFRAVLVRSLAYLLVTAVLLLIYLAIGFLVSVIFAGSVDILNAQTAGIFFVVSILIASTFTPLKKFFDKLTNRFFYRDSYDTQAFLNELNQVIVGNIEIGILLRHVANVIEDNLKCQFCVIAIKDQETGKLKIRNESKVKISSRILEDIKQELVKKSQKIVINDDTEISDGELKKMLVDNNIAIVRPLLGDYSKTNDAIAYMILGPKKSGNIYSRQDIRIVNIISDELLIAIQNALRFEEIQQFNIVLQQRIEEATAKLRRTNLKLKEMDETKDEFISMASHQLRTPLTSVKGYLSMVLDGDAGSLKPQQKELLEQSFLSSQRMVYIIADLLNVSRLKTGKFVLDINPTDLVGVVQGEIAQLHEAFKTKKLKITFTKPKDFPSLLLDETKIRQVIMNFVDNAVYYTPAGGNIWVELKQDKKHVYFTVRDSGLGVPKAEQSHLFGKFYRASNARKARPDGTGLGLFMAKRVVVAQGGSILFESVEGKGSTFGFCFETAKLLPEDKK